MSVAAKLATLPERQRELFRQLETIGGWVKPKQLGGSDGTHHSKTLRTLVAHGLVDTMLTDGVRGARYYRARETIAKPQPWPIRERLMALAGDRT